MTVIAEPCQKPLLHSDVDHCSARVAACEAEQ